LGYLLDTNIAIEIGNLNEHVLGRFVPNAEASALSVLNLVELERGIALAPNLAQARRERLHALLETVPVLPFDQAAAEVYGWIIAQLGWVRARDFDRMIAAHAISTSSILVTNNEADFRDIPGLTIENWAAG
jgi:tRNA(fMet)-specific endonuclease VapC